MEFHTSMQKCNLAIQGMCSEHLFGAVICTRCWEDAKTAWLTLSELTQPWRGQLFIHLPPIREGHLSAVLDTEADPAPALSELCPVANTQMAIRIPWGKDSNPRWMYRHIRARTLGLPINNCHGSQDHKCLE